jgi:hypothetical protein
VSTLICLAISIAAMSRAESIYRYNPLVEAPARFVGMLFAFTSGLALIIIASVP